MSLFSAAMADQAAALALPPPVVLASARQSPRVLRSLIVVAAGGRDLDWSPTRVAVELKARTHGHLVQLLLHGGARGADWAIDTAAHRLGWAVEILRPDWVRLGRAAGPVRNGQMLRRALQEASAHTLMAPTGVLVIAFPGHRGTASLVEQARRLEAGSPVPFQLHQVEV